MMPNLKGNRCISRMNDSGHGTTHVFASLFIGGCGVGQGLGLILKERIFCRSKNLSLRVAPILESFLFCFLGFFKTREATICLQQLSPFGTWWQNLTGVSITLNDSIPDAKI